jgi:5'-deoxynucleotidase YfbR-like HD superfamily hydrolase
MSHFFAYLSRMKFINRWNTMRNTKEENIQEHSLQVAMIAHAIALIKNKYYEGQLTPERVALLAIYHEASEVITGDMATPIKYYNPEIRDAYKRLEKWLVNDCIIWFRVNSKKSTPVYFLPHPRIKIHFVLSNSLIKYQHI